MVSVCTQYLGFQRSAASNADMAHVHVCNLQALAAFPETLPDAAALTGAHIMDTCRVPLGGDGSLHRTTAPGQAAAATALAC